MCSVSFTVGEEHNDRNNLIFYLPWLQVFNSTFLMRESSITMRALCAPTTTSYWIALQEREAFQIGPPPTDCSKACQSDGVPCEMVFQFLFARSTNRTPTKNATLPTLVKACIVSSAHDEHHPARR